MFQFPEPSSGQFLKTQYCYIQRVHALWDPILFTDYLPLKLMLNSVSRNMRSDPKEHETNPIAQEPRLGGERQTDSYRTCSDLSQCYKAQLNLFT